MTETSIEDRISWHDSDDSYYGPEDYPEALWNRYPNFKVLGGFVDVNAFYSFDIVALFWDKEGRCYYVGNTSGCSCPSPWDDSGYGGTTELYGPFFEGAARKKLAELFAHSEFVTYSTDEYMETQRALKEWDNDH